MNAKAIEAELAHYGFFVDSQTRKSTFASEAMATLGVTLACEWLAADNRWKVVAICGTATTGATGETIPEAIDAALRAADKKSDDLILAKHALRSMKAVGNG